MCVCVCVCERMPSDFINHCCLVRTPSRREQSGMRDRVRGSVVYEQLFSPFYFTSFSPGAPSSLVIPSPPPPPPHRSEIIRSLYCTLYYFHDNIPPFLQEPERGKKYDKIRALAHARAQRAHFLCRC